MVTRSSSYLPPHCADWAATKKAVKAIVEEWTKLPPPNPSDFDETEPFVMLDLVGSGSPEAKGERVAATGGELNEAPCGKCHIDACPGTIGECLLNVAPFSVFGLIIADDSGVSTGFFMETIDRGLIGPKLYQFDTSNSSKKYTRAAAPASRSKKVA